METSKIMETGKFRIVLLQHGETEWDLKKLTTGWYDTKLSERGIHEAMAAGKSIRRAEIKFDIAFTSKLTRAKETLRMVLEEINQSQIPIEESWQLNDRHFGALTGLNCEQIDKQFYSDKNQDKPWLTIYDSKPPPMDKNHPFHALLTKDTRYRGHLPKDEFPTGESMKDTVDRVECFWKKFIMPELMMRKTVLIVAHMNSLKGILKLLQDIPDTEILKLNLPNAVPFVYNLNCKFKPVDGATFLGDEITVQKATEMAGSIAAKPKSK